MASTSDVSSNSLASAGSSTSAKPTKSLPLPFNIGRARSETATDLEHSILTVVGEALKPLESEPESLSELDHGTGQYDIVGQLATQRICAQAAAAIDALCPSVENGVDVDISEEVNRQDRQPTAPGVDDRIGDFIWAVWTILLSVARVVPHDAEHPGQATIVGILDALSQLQRGTVTLWGQKWRLWQDLPLFRPFMADHRAGPDAGADRDALTEDVITKWHNQSAFAARCLEAGIGGWYDYATRALHLALEVDEKEGGGSERSKALQRCSRLAATAWVIHSGPTLLRWARQNDDDREDSEEDSEDGKAVYDSDSDEPPGPLFTGRPGLSRARWDFWKERFKTLLEIATSTALTDDVRTQISLAVDRMEAVETAQLAREAELLRNLMRDMGVDIKLDFASKMGSHNDYIDIDRKFTIDSVIEPSPNQHDSSYGDDTRQNNDEVKAKETDHAQKGTT
ncbi:hypothetical protein SEUCBS140593_009669 [Sporothrix eucalyptigena]|uniref:Uncharacterized protein n=1 Tax=Sporothrix eucalyptigena TaxID=1812306 RepID=A0ABP0D0B7_9PEZI